MKMIKPWQQRRFKKAKQNPTSSSFLQRWCDSHCCCFSMQENNRVHMHSLPSQLPKAGLRNCSERQFARTCRCFCSWCYYVKCICFRTGVISPGITHKTRRSDQFLNSLFVFVEPEICRSLRPLFYCLYVVSDYVPSVKNATRMHISWKVSTKLQKSLR